jgi:lycopene cyclase CruA
MSPTSMAGARGRVREAGGDELVERLDHLDATRRESGIRPTRIAPPAPQAGDAVDCDVLFAGGGLWSLLAPLLAARGLRVTVLERARAGRTHREWNASGPELSALVECGLFDQRFLDRLIVARYDRGVCRFAGGGDHPVTGVLDHAVDAALLLASARTAAEQRGVTFLDGHDVRAHASGPGGVRVAAAAGTREVTLTGRVLIDARGAASPYATADLVCPTVGGVLAGLAEGEAGDEVNPRVGEILATVDGVVNGRQHVWEAFPGRPGETTVYLFHYAHATETVSLVELYARFFDTLPGYKRGDARLLRPTFGYIPGWSRLRSAPRSPDPRVVLVGDAAARHSPLTYCGFGSMLRSLARTADDIARAAAGGGAAGMEADDAPVHSMTGGLAHMMASRGFRGNELNDLLDVAFRMLHSMGNDTYAQLLRDEMAPDDFVDFLRRTARAHPAVWKRVVRALPPWMAARWGVNVARSFFTPRA